MVKIVLQGKQARDKIKKGVDIAADLIKTTLGPAGRNVLIWWQNKWPLPTDDGATIARKLELVVEDNQERPDETVNLGLLSFTNGVIRANDVAGDGTTTTAVIAQKIIHEGFKRLDEQDKSFIGTTLDVKSLSDEIIKA